MELFTYIMLAAIFAETSTLLVMTRQRSKNGGKLPRRKLFVDTSILMDGRILSVARAGFLGDEVLIPRSVIRELQLLADGSDSEKRSRARYGLDVANELERVELAHVEFYQDSIEREKVDERLISLAKANKGVILTNDFNLIKVAATEHVDAISINDLAQGLRSEYLPGDQLSVKIISAGSNPRQGVAYLPDGTMVVVDDAMSYIGKAQPVKIEFVRYLQTAAGKMMFAKIIKETPRKGSSNSNRRVEKRAKIAKTGRKPKTPQSKNTK